MSKEPINLPEGTTVGQDISTVTDWMRKTGIKLVTVNISVGSGSVAGDDYDPSWDIWASGVQYGSLEDRSLKHNKRIFARIAIATATNMGSMSSIAASNITVDIAADGAILIEHTDGFGRKTTRSQLSPSLKNAPYKGELLSGADLNLFYLRIADKMPPVAQTAEGDLEVLRDWMSERGITAANISASRYMASWTDVGPKWHAEKVYFDGFAGNGDMSGFGPRVLALAILGLDARGSDVIKGPRNDDPMKIVMSQDGFTVEDRGKSYMIDAALLAKTDIRSLRDGKIRGLEIPASIDEVGVAAVLPTYLGKEMSLELAERINATLRAHNVVDAQGYSVVDCRFLDLVTEVVVIPGYEDKIGEDLLAGVRLRTINGIYPASTSAVPERKHEHAFLVTGTALGPVLLSGNGSRESGFIVRNDLHSGNYQLKRGNDFPDMYDIKGPHQGRMRDAYEVTFTRVGGEIKDLKVKDILQQGSLTYLRENLRMFNQLCEHFSAGLDDNLRVIAKDERSAEILGSARFMAMRTDTDALATFAKMILNPPEAAKAAISEWLESKDTLDLYRVRDVMGIENDLKGQNIIGEIDASAGYGRRALKAHQFAQAYEAYAKSGKEPEEPKGSQSSFDM